MEENRLSFYSAISSCLLITPRRPLLIVKPNPNELTRIFNLTGKMSSIISSTDTEEVLTYEEISRYYPQPNRKRPIVLIGPSNVGRQELQQRLIDSDPERFGAPVPRNSFFLFYHLNKFSIS